MLVATLVAEAALGALDAAATHGLVQDDVVQCDLAIFLPAEVGIGSLLCPVDF